MTSYFAPVALVGPTYDVQHDVRIDVSDGVIAAVSTGADPSTAEPLGDVAVPGFANCHSHLFHRALRGRTSGSDRAGGIGSFWTWREQMYALADVLDPELMHRLARAVYGEMAAAGVSAVGEFHYLHHGPSGEPYADPNAMGEAVIEAAREVGLRITLLDTCYLSAGFDREPEGVQRRFSDGDAANWAERVGTLAARYAHDDGIVVGAAVHSVRAVPEDQLATVAAWASTWGVPLHVHLSEQPAENADCLAATGQTPTGLLASRGVLGPRTTAVHATHLTDDDVATLGSHGVYAAFCPSTERDLADGVGPSRRLHDAGSALTLGSDSNAVIDLFEEMRLVELHERLVSNLRGTWQPTELLAAACANGQRSLGFLDAGVIEVGRRADLVGVSYEGVGLAGASCDANGLVFAATADDVATVVVDGVVIEPRDAAVELRSTIEACWSRT